MAASTVSSPIDELERELFTPNQRNPSFSSNYSLAQIIESNFNNPSDIELLQELELVEVLKNTLTLIQGNPSQFIEQTKVTADQANFIKRLDLAFKHETLPSKNTFYWNSKEQCEIYIYDKKKGSSPSKDGHRVKWDGEHDLGNDIYCSYAKIKGEGVPEAIGRCYWYGANKPSPDADRKRKKNKSLNKDAPNLVIILRGKAEETHVLAQIKDEIDETREQVADLTMRVQRIELNTPPATPTSIASSPSSPSEYNVEEIRRRVIEALQQTRQPMEAKDVRAAIKKAYKDMPDLTTKPINQALYRLKDEGRVELVTGKVPAFRFKQ